MATKTKKSINKELVSQYAKDKKYVYNWLLDGAGSTDYLISDRLSSFNFEFGLDTSVAGATKVDAMTLTDGNSASFLKTIAAAYVAIEKNTTGAQDTIETYNFAAPGSLTVSGVDATTLFGGAVISSSCTTCSTNSFTTNATTRYENVDAIVDGGANLAIAGTTITTVYGGGAGYGSILEGDVNMSFTSTNRIGTVYGGGQKGAVVNGDVNITISRADATEGGRIGTVYGGGDNAVVNGDVYITVDGTNAVTVGTISGSGKGAKARVTGTRTLEIADFSGKFSSNIKDFDTIKITGSSSVVLTQTQNRSIQSAVYEFVLDDEAVSVGQKSAMLTWNKDVDLGQIVITIDGDLDNVENGFSKTIYASTYATADIIDNILVRTLKDDGTYALSSTATSVYSLEFVADTDSKGNAKSKGGKVVLNYTGSKISVDASTGEDLYLSEQGEKVSIKPSADSNVVRSSVNAAGGDDEVTIQTNTLMAGDIALGEGKNTLRVQGDAEMTGSIIVDENSENKIYVNGTISQIEGGDETTKNFVYINTPNAVGYYKNSTDVNDKDATGAEQRFIPQALVFTGKSEDTVYLSEVATNIPAISFGEGQDTLVLNTSLTAQGADTRITSDDGNDAIIANQTGITIDADKLKLAGTDNIFVVTNGVKAAVTGTAFGNFEKQYAGIYLGQNAIIDVNGELAVQSYEGVLQLNEKLTVLKAPEYSDELAERIGTYYTAGDGVKANIFANGQELVLREGASVNGNVYNAGNVYFSDNAGGEDLLFKNDAGTATTIEVEKNAVATVGSIAGITGTSFVGADDFEAEAAQVTLNEDAALYAADDKNLLVGNITKDTDFAAKYGDKATGTISVIDAVKAGVKFTDATVYLANNASFDGGIQFAGTNKVAVKSAKIVLDNEQMFFADDSAKVEFTVQDGAELVFDGIAKDGTFDESKISVKLDKNARFAYGDTLKTGSWSEKFDATKLDGRTNIAFAADSLVDATIDLDDAQDGLTVSIADGAKVKGDLTVEDFGTIRLGQGEDTLNIAKAAVNGKINAANDAAKDTLNLAGTQVTAMVSQDNVAIELGGEDELNLTDGAKVSGNIAGGDEVYVKDSEVTGSVGAAKTVLNNATVGSLVTGEAFVESGSTTEKNVSKIGAVDASKDNVTLYADVATAEVGAITGTKDNGKAALLLARLGGTIKLDGLETTLDTVGLGAVHAGSSVDFGGKDVKVVGNKAMFEIADGGALANLGNIEVAGGMENVSGAKLTGELATADEAWIKSNDGADITAKDVTFVADESTIVIDSAESKNTFGNILQSGAIKQEAYKMTTTYTQADKAAVGGTMASFKAESITQYAKDAAVQVAADADVGAIAQTAEKADVAFTGTAKVAGIAQTATESATVTLDGTAEIADGIVQKGESAMCAPLAEAKVTIAGTAKTTVEQEAAKASVIANAAIDQTYKAGDAFSFALEDVEMDALARSVGTITQTGDANTVTLGANIAADGLYKDDKHKRAKVTVGSVALENGDITQTGDANTVTAEVAYSAQGESDVKIGATALTMGAISQTNNEGTTNTVSIKASSAVSADSVMELGDVTAQLSGGIKQKAYKAANKVDLSFTKSDDEALKDVNVALAVAGGISMLAYGDGATNELNVAGKVSVDGDVKVGGVVTDDHLSEDSTWGDRTAEKNTVTITADTAALTSNLSLVGLENVLTLNNDAFYNGDTSAKQVAQNITLAGKTNTVDIDAGVTMANIGLYDLADWDKLGKEGDDLTSDGVYTNNLKIRGEVASLVFKQKNSNDHIFLYGGSIAGDVVTGNGNDSIVLGDDHTKAFLMGDPSIKGNVTMGVEGAAEGSNAIKMQAVKANDGTVHGTTIEGEVKMFAGEKDGNAASNALAVAGGVFADANGYFESAKSVIKKDVTMNALSYGEDGTVDEGSTNRLGLAFLSEIGGNVNMTALKANEVVFQTLEEYDLDDQKIEGYAEIKGALAMKANANTLTVSAGGAAYVNGLTMENTYVEQDGTTMYLTSDTASNTIKVGYWISMAAGSKTTDTGKGVGSELIVGTDVDNVQDVAMGNAEFTKPDAAKANYVLDSVEIAAKGHDLAQYHDDQGERVKSITLQNSIEVIGRFTANNITMTADQNAIRLRGDGELGKYGVDDGEQGISDMKTVPASAEEAAKVSDEVRTASFKAGDITQAGVAYNEIVASGTNSVAHYGLDEDGNTVKTGSLQSAEFTSGNILQTWYADVDKDAETANTVSLTGSILATTGTITQLGKGDNKVEVQAYEQTDATVLGAPRSLVGEIKQGSEAVLANDNKVVLERTDVATANGALLTADKITQYATGDNDVNMRDSTSAAITQTTLGTDIKFDANTVTLNTSTTGAITQTATGTAHNQVSAYGNSWNSAKAEYETSEIDGDITQKTAQALSKDALFSNVVNAYNSNVSGSIAQTGVNRNSVKVVGAVNAVAYTNDAGQDAEYEQAFDVKVGGDITQQGGWNNTIALTDATVGGKVTQTGTDVNKLTASADVVNAAVNLGVRPADETSDDCEFHVGTKTHVSSTIQSQADFNTQAIKGDITQTGGVKDDDELKALQDAGVYAAPANTIAVDNVNLANVTQTQTDGYNSLAVNASFDGVITKLGEYQGEVDEDLNPVNKVETFQVNTTTEVGNIAQTGVGGTTIPDLGTSANNMFANVAGLKGVTAGTVTQTASEEGNYLEVSAVQDVTKKIVDVVTWNSDPDFRPGDTNKEEVTPTVLQYRDADGNLVDTANVRAGNTLGAITQTTAVSENYPDEEGVYNAVGLENTTVNGNVTQKALGTNALVGNILWAVTSAQNFADVATVGEKQEVTWTRTTLDDINGSIEQVGEANVAAVVNVNVNGTVDQTANMIETKAHHGDQLDGQKSGTNWFEAAGSEDQAVDAMGLKEEQSIVKVTGNITQTVNNNGNERYIDDLKTSYNDVTVALTDLADVTQTLTYGANGIDIGGNVSDDSILAIGTLPNTVTQAGNLSQTGNWNDIDADDVAIASVTQDAYSKATVVENIHNEFDIAGDTTSAIIKNADPDAAFDPETNREVVVQEAMENATKVGDVKQTITISADAKGYFDFNQDAWNDVDAYDATVGNVTQVANGWAYNEVDFEGSRHVAYKLDEDKASATYGKQIAVSETNVQSIGTIDQTGFSNEANIDSATSSGKITQVAASLLGTYTTTDDQGDEDPSNDVTTVTTGLNDYLWNDADFRDVDQAADVSQTATSVAYKKITSVTTGTADPVVTETETAVDAENEVEAYRSNLANVKQIVQDEEGVTGVATGDNVVYGYDSNFGDITQTTQHGYNYISIDNDRPSDDTPNAHYTAGNVTQTGVENGVGAETTAFKVVKQTAVALEGDEDVDNYFNLVSDLVVGVGTRDGVTPENPQTISAAKKDLQTSGSVESVTQVTKVLDADAEGYYSATDADNYISLLGSNAGAISQSGNGYTENDFRFGGDEVKTYDGHDADGFAKVITNEKVNTLGTTVQMGVDNDAEIVKAKSVGTIDQTAAAVKVISTTFDDKENDDPADDTTTIVKTMTRAENDLDMYDVDQAGNITQTATSVAYETSTSVQVGEADPTVTKDSLVVKAYNEIEVGDSNLADVTQTIQDAEGATGVATGSNWIFSEDTNFGNVKQTTVKGQNLLVVETYRTGDNVPAAAATVGTVDQQGSSNTIDADVADFGAVTQKAVALADAQELTHNTFYLNGDFVYGYANPAEGSVSTTNPQILVNGGQDLQTSGSVVSVTQTATALAADEEGYFAKKIVETPQGEHVNEYAAENYFLVEGSNAGDVKQSGTGYVKNEAAFAGWYVETWSIDAATGYAQDDSWESVNTLGSVDQDGVENSVYVSDALSAGTITQDATSVKTITTTVSTTTETDDTTTIVKTQEDVENSARFYGAEDAAGITQTATGVAFEEITSVQIGDAAPVETKVAKVTNTENSIVAIASDVAYMTQTGAQSNKIEIDDYSSESYVSTIGAIEQTAAFAGTGLESGAYNVIGNQVLFGDDSYTDGVVDGRTIASIKQEALGAYAVESVEGVDTVTKDIWGYNYVQVEHGGVTGTIDQNAAGFKAMNDIESYGEVKSTKAPTAVGGLDYENGSYLNSLGDIKQYLNSSIDKAGWDDSKVGAENKLDVDNTNLGKVAQEGADNTYSYNYIYVRNDLTGYETITTNPDPLTQVSSSIVLKATIGSIDQKGFENYAGIYGASLDGNITIRAKGIYKKTAEGEDWSFGANALYLEEVDAKDISVTTEVGTVSVGGVTYVNAAAASKVTLESVTANNVETGTGNDSIAIKDNSTITGTIDMGANTWTITSGSGETKILTPGEDELMVSGDAADLTQATIKNVEWFGWYDDDQVITVASLDADTIYYGSSGKGKVVATEITTSDTSWVYALQGAHTGSAVTDKLTLEATLDESVDAIDFDLVTFKDGATGANITWKDSTATDGDVIKFTGFTFDEHGKFTIGSIDNEYANEDITLNYGGKDYTWNGVDAFTNENDTKGITLQRSAGTISYGLS